MDAWAEKTDDPGSGAVRSVRAAWQQILGALSALAVLAVLLPAPVRCLDVIAGRSSGFRSDTGPAVIAETAILLVAAALVWSLLLWGSTVVLVALVGRLPGTAGIGGRALLVQIAPGIARKLVLTAVGASLVTGLSACGTGSAAAVSARPLEHQVTSWTSVEGSAVQLGTGLFKSPYSLSSGSANTEDSFRTNGSATNTNTNGSANSNDPPKTRMGAVDIDWPTGRHADGPHRAAGPVQIDWPDHSSGVVVLSGDSLWSIAARHLPVDADDMQIDMASRAWYSANATVIGTDPNLILPGQILQPPSHGTEHHS